MPFLIASYHFDYATAASLVMISNIVGSIVQPLFGSLADKFNKPWIIAFGLVFAGGGMALTGLISSFYGLCIAVMISGIGIAMFHPQAAQLVNRCSTDNNRGQSISIFSFGGNLGFTLGPILTTFAITTFGLQGTLIFIMPEVIICVLMKNFYRDLYELNQNPSSKSSNKNSSAGVDQWSSFARLTVVVFGRSIIFYGFNTFLALYLINELHQTETISNATLSFYYAISAIGTLIGGKLADKFGCRKMIRFSFSLLLLTILLFTATNNFIIATLLLLPLGIALSFSYSPIVVLGQQYLPNRVRLASGVTLGLAVSVGGILAPVLGKVADLYGLLTAFYMLAGLATIPLIFSFMLPKVNQNVSTV